MTTLAFPKHTKRIDGGDDDRLVQSRSYFWLAKTLLSKVMPHRRPPLGSAPSRTFNPSRKSYTAVGGFETFAPYT